MGAHCCASRQANADGTENNATPMPQGTVSHQDEDKFR